jgi:hypothetical protein
LAPAAPVTVAHFATAKDALQSILPADARVLAFGEYHQTNATAKAASPLARFSRELWPFISSRVTDLVVETWLSTGHCGSREEKVVDEVQTTTDRPPQTENEIVTLLKAAKAAGVAPHVLTLSCKDYAWVTGAGATTDFGKMLSLTRKRLQAEISRCLDARPSHSRSPVVAVYGGALHNDLNPAAGTRAWVFGPAISAKTDRKYVEIDLLVPELVTQESSLAREPWFDLVRSNLAAGDTLLVKRGERSYLLVFSAQANR